MKKIQKPIGVFLSLIMLFTLFNAAVLAEDVSPVTTESVTYIDENGETQTVEATVAVPGTHYASAETGWYVIEGTYSGSDALYFEDAVTNLILADDADWTVTNTDLVSIGNVNYAGGAMNVYTQANNSAELHLSGGMICYNGAMNVYGGTIISSQRIGGSPNTGDFTARNSTLTGSLYGKDITFHNCTVTGKTGSITGDFTLDGGSYTSVCGSTEAPVRAASIVITNATVEGSGGQNGLQANGGSVTISNSTVNVSTSNMAIMGSDVTISGGSVTATASGNFGIYSSGLIEITGGAVTAQGGTFGLYGQAGVVLTGGNVTASGNVAGVNAGSALTLGADDPGSSYTLDSVLSGATVTVQEGRTLTDGENEYSGTLTAEQVATLAGKTLVGVFTYTPVPEKEPTCDEDGNIAYYECSNGRYYVIENDAYIEIALADTVIPGGHVYCEEDWTAATFADCGNDGVLPHFTCRRCGEPIDLEGNVMDSVIDPATGDHDWSTVWTWTADYTATATFTCSVCEAQTSVEADVTYDAETYIYTATAELDGEPYTDTKQKTVTLTFEMGGKCENYVTEAEVGSSIALPYYYAVMAARAEGYNIHGFTPLPPESYDSHQAYVAALAAMSLAAVPETDAVYYAMWNVRITPAFTVGEVKCGTDLAENAPVVICDEPEKFHADDTFWTDEAPGAAVGGTAYEMYLCLTADFGWCFNWEEEPGIAGAEVVQEQLNGTQHYFLLNVTAAHYADETSEIKETVLTPATATTDGVKQICVYCAGGCGEIVETRTEVIPATGEPAEPTEPADTDKICRWCGETHDKRTFIGWWTEFIHDLFYIIRQLFCWWA